MTPNTKLAELHNLKPEETKSLRPVDIAALNLQTDDNDVVAYVYTLMPVERPETHEEKFWFPTLKTLATNQKLS